MNETLIIYDEEGNIFSRCTGIKGSNYAREPVGLPHIYAEEKEGYYISSIDTTVDPPLPVYTKDTSTENSISDRIQNLEIAMAAMYGMEVE